MIGTVLDRTERSLYTLPPSNEREVLAVRVEAFSNVVASWSYAAPSVAVQALVYRRVLELPELVERVSREDPRW